MSRSWLDSSQKKPQYDQDFNLKSFRTQVKDRIQPCSTLTSDNSSYRFNSSKKNANQQSVPSFENLQARIRDFSYSRLNVVSQLKSHSPLKNVPQLKSQSPHKFQGLSQKITDSIGPKYQSQQGFSPNKYQQSPNYSSQRPYVPLKFSLQAPEKSLFQNKSFQSRKNLADVVQLNEVITLRNKIEGCQILRGSLTSTYVTELTKLAQAIISSLKE